MIAGLVNALQVELETLFPAAAVTPVVTGDSGDLNIGYAVSELPREVIVEDAFGGNVIGVASPTREFELAVDVRTKGYAALLQAIETLIGLAGKAVLAEGDDHELAVAFIEDGGETGQDAEGEDIFSSGRSFTIQIEEAS